MSRILLGIVAATAGLFAPAAAPAPAPLASPTLLCKVFPSTTPPQPYFCSTFRASGSYLIDNSIPDGPASGYVWTVPAGTAVHSGCASDTPFCTLAVRARNRDQDFTISVFIPGSGTRSVTASIPAVCGRDLC